MRIFLIGIGTGNINHITLEAINTLNDVDLILIPKKTKETQDLLDIRKNICKKFIKNNKTKIIEFCLPYRNLNNEYFLSVNNWHEEVAKAWNKSIKNYNGEKNKVALLIWGDPCLYDSSIRIAKQLVKISEIEIIPGITSIQALTSSHKINLNEVGKSVIITTGRQIEKAGNTFHSLTSIVMLDGKCSFKYLDGCKFYIWWGAYLGMQNEILHKGLLLNVSKEIIEIREHEKKKHGWIMDTYILHKINHND